MPGPPTRAALARRAAALGLGMLVLGASGAVAATTVEFKVGGGRFDGFSGVAVEGDRGVNRIAVSFDEETNRYSIRDRASRLLGPECERVNRHALRCEAAFQGELRVRGNDGNDVTRGPGGDDLLGARDEFGRDVFEGGGGDDLVSAVNRDADRRIDCGPGRDKAFVDRQDPRTKRCERVRTIEP
jgi:hypothetical protein